MIKMKQSAKKQAFGAIGILISLFIISIIFILMMPMLKDFGTGAGLNTSIKTQNVEKRVNEQIDEITKMRQQQQQMNSNIYNQEN